MVHLLGPGDIRGSVRGPGLQGLCVEVQIRSLTTLVCLVPQFGVLLNIMLVEHRDSK